MKYFLPFSAKIKHSKSSVFFIVRRGGAGAPLCPLYYQYIFFPLNRLNLSTLKECDFSTLLCRVHPVSRVDISETKQNRSGAQLQPHGYSPQLTFVSSYILPHSNKIVKYLLCCTKILCDKIPRGAELTSRGHTYRWRFASANTTACLFTLAHGVCSTAELSPL